MKTVKQTINSEVRERGTAPAIVLSTRTVTIHTGTAAEIQVEFDRLLDDGYRTVSSINGGTSLRMARPSKLRWEVELNVVR